MVLEAKAVELDSGWEVCNNMACQISINKDTCTESIQTKAAISANKQTRKKNLSLTEKPQHACASTMRQYGPFHSYSTITMLSFDIQMTTASSKIHPPQLYGAL